MRLFEQPWFLIGGGAIGVLGSLVGFPLVLTMLVAMMVIDVVVGVAVAWQKGALNSKKSFDGGIRKFVIICVVMATWLIQYMLAVIAYDHLSPYLPDTPANVPLAEFVGSYFILYTFISILENAVRAGIRLPRQLTSILKVGPEAASGPAAATKGIEPPTAGQPRRGNIDDKDAGERK